MVKKKFEINPSIIEDVYKAQPPEEQFKALHAEWMDYQGKVMHPTKGIEVSKHELRQEELGEIVDKESKKLKNEIPKEEVFNVEKVGKTVFELAKRVYMEQHAIKTVTDEKVLNENVKALLTSIARDVTEDPDMTYDKAIAAILSAKDPIYGKGEDRSKILDQLLQQYAALTHKSEYAPTKGHSVRRLSHLESRLNDPYLRDEWLREHGDVLKKYGYKAKFGKNAQSRHIRAHTAELLGIGETNIKQPYIDVKLPAERKKPQY